MSSGVFPSRLKAAFFTPLLKKPTLDPSDGKSYRPISNLSVLSKLFERIVALQLIDPLNTWKLETDANTAISISRQPLDGDCMLRVISDILDALDRGYLNALTLLDLSAAFDIVDHKTLIRRLETCYGIRCSVLDWFSTYLEQRTQHVWCRGHSSNPLVVLCGSL